MRIGLVLNILDEEYQISVYSGILKKARKLGVEIICFQQEYTNFSSDDLISTFSKKEYFDLDGIILLTSVITDNYEINQKKDVEKIWGNIPVVSVGQRVQDVPSLLIQTDDSMKQLVEHLILQHKYRNFLYISGSQNHHDAIIREQIFTKTMEAYKPWFSDLSYTIKRGCFTEGTAIDAMTEYYSENNNKKLDVVVCANDNMAIGVYKFFKINKKNPRIHECAVTGFDDIPQAKFEIPSLTTVHQPMEEIGEKAMEMIKRMVDGKSVKEETYIESEIVFRKSCGCNIPDFVNREEMEPFYSQMQINYVQSENLLRMVSHIGQEMNNAENLQGLNNLINQNMLQLDLKNFCILSFSEDNGKMIKRKSDNILVNPLYVRRNGKEYPEFYKETKIPLGQFYKRLVTLENRESTSLVFKYLIAGNEIIGCVLYDGNEQVLPYLSSISINIAQALSRIRAMEERKRRSEYLEQEVTKRTKELVEANNKRMEVEAEVLKISEIERQRFSNDLHDDICQRLAGISMLCRCYTNQEEPIEKSQMEELTQLIGETLQCTRQYAHNSYPVELESLGMNHSLSNLCDSFSSQSGISCDYFWSLPESCELNKLQKLNLFRIIQEALHNIMKHAKATEVSVNVDYEDGKVVVKVADNGCGIDKTKLKNSGLGLNSMQYRANQIGADFLIKENKPSGTCVQVSVDL